MALIHTIDHPAVSGIRVGSVDRNGRYRLNGSCIVYQLGNTVIDTGPSREWKVVRDFFADQAIRHALITHYHEDHSGNGHHFQSAMGCQVHSHHHGHHHLSSGFPLSFIRWLSFGKVKAFSPTALPDELQTSNGQRLLPLHMPGHSDDMSCFLEPNEGWLFSGDLYIASQIKYMMAEEDVGLLIDSLKQAMALDFDTLFCAHRGIVYDGKAALAKKHDTLVSLKEEVTHWHQQGLSARQITRKLLGREDGTALLSSMQMSKLNVIRACLKGLEAS